MEGNASATFETPCMPGKSGAGFKFAVQRFLLFTLGANAPVRISIVGTPQRAAIGSAAVCVPMTTLERAMSATISFSFDFFTDT